MEIYRGQSDVRLWCGSFITTGAAVSNWIRRHPDLVPEPDVLIVNEGSDTVLRGWAPGRRAEWEAFAIRQKKGPRPETATRARRTADQIVRQMETGNIDPAVAAGLLRELIGRPKNEED